MKKFSYKDKPIKVYGIPFFEKHKKFQRLPDDLLEILQNKLPYFPRVGRRCPGARLCFRTNSQNFKIEIEMETLTKDIGMSLFACQSAHVLIGDRKTARFLGLVAPTGYDNLVFEKSFSKSSEMEDITVFLPTADVIKNVEISIDDNAKIEAPTPYKYSTPVVFYGSSITEGASCQRPTNTYSAALSNRLDFDYYNIGFSGGAKGTVEVADFINSLDKSVFVLDYDHNAPSVEHLEATHEAFFKRIREKNPDLPIIMMTSPDFDYAPDKAARRDVVRRTYENAKNNGDNNVYFVDGETFFGDKDRHACTSDTCHPNDLGAYRMTEVIEPIMKMALESTKQN